ncbi:MAG: O-antigen ligase family protein [Pseudomonadota bacterium]
MHVRGGVAMTQVQLWQQFRGASPSHKVWLGSLFFFSVAVFTSKAGYSSFGLLLIFGSFFAPWRNAWITEKKVLAIAALYPIAIFLSFFSVGGLFSVWTTFSAWPWPLLVLPATVVFKDRKLQPYVLAGAAAGFSLAIVEAMRKILLEQWATFIPSVSRIDSFWDLGRWGVLLSCVTVALYVYATATDTEVSKKRIYWGAWGVALVFLVLAGQRAPWVAASIGMLLVSLTSRRRFIAGLGVAGVIAVLMLSLPGLRHRVESVGAVHTQGSIVTSTDGSNAARLHMWQVALDFFREQAWFGVGFKNTETPLRAFLERQSTQYRGDHLVGEFSINDQHSSYLSVLVERGVLFSLIFGGLIVYILLSSIKNLMHNPSAALLTSYAVCMVNFVIYVFYTSIQSFESLPLFLGLAYIALRREPTR